MKITEKCAEIFKGGMVMKNGDISTVTGISVEAVPAYNLVHKRDNGHFFHPKGEGNGYVLTCGDKRIYVAADHPAKRPPEYRNTYPKDEIDQGSVSSSKPSRKRDPDS